jgi:acetylornithine deacetylase/succinyl-diaminopimelate desuccinylase-like protein
MIFIPCFKGYSHRPDEFSSPAQIEKGVRVLAEMLARLAGG